MLWASYLTLIFRVLSSPMPFVLVFQDAFVDINPTLAFTGVVLSLIIVVAVSSLAATSRLIYAFAYVAIRSMSLQVSQTDKHYSRDNGPPYSTWLGYVDRRFDVPVNAILLTLVFTCCMSLVNLGSEVAFEAMVSLATVALMATYIISTGCVLLKRLRGEGLPSSR